VGQAKNRKAEINALKSAPKKTFSILAIRHTECGSREMVCFQASYAKPVHNKKDLLAYICLKDWLHTPPVGAITDYLFQTNTFAMTEQFGITGYEINFYEVDDELTAKNGNKTYSCRLIVGCDAETVGNRADALAEELAASGLYSVKRDHPVVA